MKEIKDILHAFDKAQKEGKQTALATVVQVKGSSYRRPGARMLITEDGKLTGAISGGCLEGDALRKALLVMQQQQPMIVTYDTTDEDDAKVGVGLGCHGIIQILIEPIVAEKQNNAIQLFKELIAKREVAVVVTVVSLENKRGADQGTLMMVKANQSITSNNGINHISPDLIKDANQALKTNTSSIKTYTNNYNYTAFIEVIQPVISLIIIGAGSDAMPLVQLVNVLGWNVTVLDGRSNYAAPDRFPTANNIIITKAENILDNLSIDEQTAVVLFTHNYNYDLTSLRLLLTVNVKYIGSLGPKKKLQRMLDELQQEGVEISEDQMKAIYGPVGLDIGAETPEEIALSVIAEIKSVFSHRLATSLREKQTPIHIIETTEIEHLTL